MVKTTKQLGISIEDGRLVLRMQMLDVSSVAAGFSSQSSPRHVGPQVDDTPAGNKTQQPSGEKKTTSHRDVTIDDGQKKGGIIPTLFQVCEFL